MQKFYILIEHQVAVIQQLVKNELEKSQINNVLQPYKGYCINFNQKLTDQNLHITSFDGPHFTPTVGQIPEGFSQYVIRFNVYGWSLESKSTLEIENQLQLLGKPEIMFNSEEDGYITMHQYYRNLNIFPANELETPPLITRIEKKLKTTRDTVAKKGFLR